MIVVRDNDLYPPDAPPAGMQREESLPDADLSAAPNPQEGAVGGAIGGARRKTNIVTASTLRYQSLDEITTERELEEAFAKKQEVGKWRRLKKVLNIE